MRKRLKTLRLLVVDDDLSALFESCKQIVKEIYGVELIIATDANEALRKVNAISLDIIITDMKMNGDEFDGLWLIKEVKASKPLIKIFAITGYPEEYPASAVKAAGADGYFTKPTALRVLLDTVLKKDELGSS